MFRVGGYKNGVQRGCKCVCSVSVGPRCPPGRKTCHQETLGYSSGHGGYGGVVWVASEMVGGGGGAGGRGECGKVCVGLLRRLDDAEGSGGGEPPSGPQPGARQRLAYRSWAEAEGTPLSVVVAVLPPSAVAVASAASGASQVHSPIRRRCWRREPSAGVSAART
jgi:hypothetical protein